MKKSGLIIAAFALVLGLSQCKKPNAPLWNNDSYNVQTITFSNADNDGQKGNFQISGTNLLDYHWVNTPEYTDVIHVYATKNQYKLDGTTDFSSLSEHCGVLDNIDIHEGETTATFTGTVNIPEGTQALRFVHFGKLVTVNANGSATVDFPTQAGTLPFVSDYVVAVCDEQYTGGNVFENCELKLQFAIVKLQFDGFGIDDNITVKGMNATGLNVATTGNITYNTNTSSTLTKPGTDVFYTVFMPNELTNYVFSSSNIGVANSAAWELVANKYYTKDDGGTPSGDAVVVKKIQTVNFDLPSYPKLEWTILNNLGATCGSTDESWYGGRYAWGEPKPYNQIPSTYADWSGSKNSGYEDLATNRTIKTDYSWDYYKWGTGIGSTSGDPSNMLKYTETDGMTVLEATDDMATVLFGNPWRISTQEEWQELYDYCTFEYMIKGNTSTNVTTFTAPTNGYLVVKGGKKEVTLDPSKYMFLPAGGSRNGNEDRHYGEHCYYWSSSLSDNSYESNITDAYYVRLKTPSDEDPVIEVHNAFGYRCHGFSVRPVYTAE